MTAKAYYKDLDISAKKIRPLMNLVRGSRAVDALDTLSVYSSRSARVLIKLIKSALANAEDQNFSSNDNLKISTIMADEGPIMKRFRAKARGRAGAFNRPSSHLTVELDEVGE